MGRYYKYLLLILVLFVGCQHKKDKIGEGQIEYEVTYLEMKKDDILAGVLPKTMYFLFKNNNTVSKIEGFFGVFCLAQIYNNQRTTFSTTLKMLNKKYIYEVDANTLGADFHEMHVDSIAYGEEQKEIAGFMCKKAVAYVQEAKEPIILYYTNEIGVEKPNAYTPYKEIDGVLMQYQLYLNNMKMKLTATNVVGMQVPDETFEIPYGYVPVSKEDLQKIVKNITGEEQN